MKVIVDTHVFLWVVFSPKKLSKKAKDVLLDPQNTKTVSAVTFWEVSLKYQLGKINLKGIYPDQLVKVAKKIGFEILNLDAEVASSFYKLPKQTQDPFDRMLTWQAISGDYNLVTRDLDFAAYKDYGLKTVW